jgi:hypothetical protein
MRCRYMLYRFVIGMLILSFPLSAYSTDVFTAENTTWLILLIIFPIPLLLLGLLAPDKIKFPVFIATLLGLPTVAYCTRQLINIFYDFECRFFLESTELNAQESFILLISIFSIVISMLFFVIYLRRNKSNITLNNRDSSEISLIILLGIGLIANIGSQLFDIANAICLPWLGLVHYFTSIRGIQTISFECFTIIAITGVLINWKITWLRILLLIIVLVNMPLPVFVLLTKNTSVKVQFNWWLYFIPQIILVFLVIMNRIKVKRIYEK